MAKVIFKGFKKHDEESKNRSSLLLLNCGAKRMREFKERLDRVNRAHAAAGKDPSLK